MPVIQGTKDYIDAYIVVNMAPMDFLAQFETITTDIVGAFANSPGDSADTATYLSYAVSRTLIRPSNSHQWEYASHADDVLSAIYNDAAFMQNITNGNDTTQGLRLLSNLFHVQAILNVAGYPRRADYTSHIENEAVPRLQQAVQTVYGPWRGYIDLPASSADYDAAISLDPRNNLLTVGTRTPAQTTGPISSVTWNLQGYGSAENKWRTSILNLLRSTSAQVMAIQEAGEPPPSWTPGNVTAVSDQFGVRRNVQYGIWNSGSLSRPEKWGVYYLDVGRLRVSLAMVVRLDSQPNAPALEVDGVRIIADGIDGATPIRPALGLDVRPIRSGQPYLTVYGFHSISAGATPGNNTPRVIREVYHHTSLPWYTVGDFNWDPRPTPWVTLPVGQIDQANGSTQPSTNPTSMLDYAVHDATTPARTGRVQSALGSDHLAVSFTLGS